jgi:hypothetical protein
MSWVGYDYTCGDPVFCCPVPTGTRPRPLDNEPTQNQFKAFGSRIVGQKFSPFIALLVQRNMAAIKKMS